MTPIDVDALEDWYREAMRRRVRELLALRPRLSDPDDLAARREVRNIAHQLRGSGGSFGLPSVTAAATVLEEASPEGLLRRLDGMVALLRAIRDHRGIRPGDWLGRSANLQFTSDAGTDLGAAWAAIAGALGIAPLELAQRIAATYDLGWVEEEAQPTRAALRLVPEALMAGHAAVPLTEDGEVIRVATPNPTNIALEVELERLTGRTPRFVVATPEWVERALAGIQVRPAPTALPPSSPDAAPSHDPDARSRVLVVDDDRSARVIARATLERRGHEVVEAGDGTQALAAVDEGAPFDLIVVDLEMPGMDGREVVRALRAPPRALATPIIVVTGVIDPVLEADLIEDGADDYIRKPLDPRLFLARVASTLRRAAG